MLFAHMVADLVGSLIATVSQGVGWLVGMLGGIIVQTCVIYNNVCVLPPNDIPDCDDTVMAPLRNIGCKAAAATAGPAVGPLRTVSTESASK